MQQTTSAGGGEYPVVTDAPTGYGETVTQPTGAVVIRPAKATEHQTDPSATCERQPYKSASGTGLVVVPPQPGLMAKALSERTIKVSWRFEAVPEDCLPASLLVSIVANDPAGATPTTVTVPYSGRTGAATLNYPDFLPPPDVALASAETANGLRSRTAKVLIER